MYTLYHCRGRASLAAHISLRRTGAPFELVAVDLDRGEQRTAGFLRLNPSGRIPVLIHQEVSLSEAAAISLYLADRHPDLGPSTDSARRANLYRWLAYLANTVQPALMLYFYPERHVRGHLARSELREAAARQVDGMFQLIDRELSPGPFLLGPGATVCDDYMFMLARWTRDFARPARRHPRVGACLERLAEQRPVREALAAEGIEEPFF